MQHFDADAVVRVQSFGELLHPLAISGNEDQIVTALGEALSVRCTNTG
ncbi:hypothetical protein Busp01_36710 [Trinickia caryophylli]|nr:hypothetical protein Busp01_36710 [Trinickia caryophylli]